MLLLLSRLLLSKILGGVYICADMLASKVWKSGYVYIEPSRLSFS